MEKMEEFHCLFFKFFTKIPHLQGYNVFLNFLAIF